MKHYADPALTDRFDVALAGAGGNGSQMLTCLARLHHAMTALGHPGFDVVVHDPDEVSDANIGRQMFAPGDVGANKAEVLVHRVNAFFGLSWEGRPGRYTHAADVALLICCVDSAKSRAAIAASVDKRRGLRYLMDMGNRAADGQVLLGQALTAEQRKRKTADDHLDLPHPYELLPELVTGGSPKDDTPSCSLAEALERQELFVNDDVTRAASLILWNLLRHGQLTWHGAFVNAATGRRAPIPVDEAAWERMRPAARTAAKGRK